MWLLESPPKKSTKVQIFMKIGLIEFKLGMTISLDMENPKWQISEKKVLKLPKFQKLISQEPFRVKWKNFGHFCFLYVGTFEHKLIKIWEYGWCGCPSLTWNYPFFNCAKWFLSVNKNFTNYLLSIAYLVYYNRLIEMSVF